MNKRALYGQKMHFMDKGCRFMDKKCCFMDKRAIYGQKVLLLGFYEKIGSLHGKKIPA
jgi:hypothetical protein